MRVADAAVSNKRRLPSGSEQATQVKPMPAKCPICEASTCEFFAGGKRPARLPPGEKEWVSGGCDTDCGREG